MKNFWIFLAIFAISLSLVSSRPNDDKYPEDDDYDLQNDGDVNDDYENDEDDEYEEDAGFTPLINTRPLTIEAMPGDTVWLPCETSHADTYAIMWNKNGTLIFQDKIEVGQKEPRYTLHSNKTLQIRNVIGNDTASYECSISTSPEPTKITHTLTVLTPAKIISVSPRDGRKEIKSGGTLELVCVAEGNPKPKIIWSKEGSRVQDKHGSYETPTLTIENVGRENSGLYQCMADNKVGSPDVSAVEIVVTHAPVIRIEKITVNQNETHLICVVHGRPHPVVSWHFNNEIINTNENFKIAEADQHSHRLEIKNTELAFGTYTCTARNKMGQKEKSITINGKPSIAHFQKNEFVGSENNVRLEWIVESSAAILEHQLQYRLKEQGATWNDEKPKVVEAEGVTYIVSHVLSNLNPGVYEARLRSKNRFGWSQYSQPTSFEGKPMTTESLAVSENREEPYGGTVGGSSVRTSSLALAVLLCLWSRLV